MPRKRKRIKNQQTAGICWLAFFDDAKGKANVTLELNVKLSQTQINELGENFEATKNGFIDFLLLDEKLPSSGAGG